MIGLKGMEESSWRSNRISFYEINQDNEEVIHFHAENYIRRGIFLRIRVYCFSSVLKKLTIDFDYCRNVSLLLKLFQESKHFQINFSSSYEDREYRTRLLHLLSCTSALAISRINLRWGNFFFVLTLLARDSFKRFLAFFVQYRSGQALQNEYSFLGYTNDSILFPKLVKSNYIELIETRPSSMQHGRTKNLLMNLKPRKR